MVASGLVVVLVVVGGGGIVVLAVVGGSEGDTVVFSQEISSVSIERIAKSDIKYSAAIEYTSLAAAVASAVESFNSIIVKTWTYII